MILIKTAINCHRFFFSVLHGLALQIYLHIEMKLVKVYRVVVSSQLDYLKTWVDFCTQKRSSEEDVFHETSGNLYVIKVISIIKYRMCLIL